MIVFAAISLIMAVFGYLAMPETKGTAALSLSLSLSLFLSHSPSHTLSVTRSLSLSLSLSLCYDSKHIMVCSDLLLIQILKTLPHPSIKSTVMI